MSCVQFLKKTMLIFEKSGLCLAQWLQYENESKLQSPDRGSEHSVGNESGARCESTLLRTRRQPLSLVWSDSAPSDVRPLSLLVFISHTSV